MKTEEIKALAIKAKEVGIAIYGTNGNKDFDSVQIDEEGAISVHFSHYYHGETEYKMIYLTPDDITNPIEETIAKYKKKEQEEADRRLKEEQENKRKQEIQKEKQERELYEKLRAKFENNNISKDIKEKPPYTCPSQGECTYPKCDCRWVL